MSLNPDDLFQHLRAHRYCHIGRRIDGSIVAALYDTKRKNGGLVAKAVAPTWEEATAELAKLLVKETQE